MLFLKDSRWRPLVWVSTTALVFTVGCKISPKEKEAGYLKRGAALVAKKDYSRALLEFQNAVAIVPQDAEPKYQMALVYLETGDTQSAIRALEAATLLNPKHSAAQLKLAELMTLTRDEKLIKEAVTRLTGAFGTSPENPEAIDIMAMAEWKLGKPEDASRHLEEALAKFPKDLRSSVDLARMKLSQRDLAGAEAVLKKAASDAPQSSPAATALGEFYLYVKQSEKAESEIKRAVQLDPKNGAALMRLASIQIAGKRLDEAEQTYKRLSALPDKSYKPLHALFIYNYRSRDAALPEFEALAKADPSDRDARTRLIAAYFGVNRPADGVKVIEAALKRNPKDSEALMQRANLSLRSGKADDAESDLKQVIRFKPDSADAHVLLASVNRAKGLVNIEHEELQEALRLNSALLPARLALATDYLSAKQVQSAVDILEKAPQSQKSQVPWVIGRNWVLISQGNLKEARANVDRVLQQAKTPDALYQSATVRLLQRDYPGSLAQLDELLKLNPADARAPELMMQVFDLQKQIPQGLDRLKQLASANPKSPSLQNLLGQWYMRTGNAAAAQQAFEAATAADAHFLPAQVSLADLEIQTGRVEQARQQLKAVIAADPQNVAALELSAQAESAAGDSKAAIDRYRQILGADSNNLTALNNIAYLLASDNLDEALKYAQHASEIAPGAAPVQDTLGWIYYRKGLYPTAVGYLKAAVAKESTPKRQFHLGMSYLKAGDRETGQRLVNQALMKDPNLPKTEKGW